MRVIITESAKSDLEEIADFIAINNPQRAISFIDELVERCESLADMPRAFPLVPRYEHYGYRRYPYRSYLIFYRLHPDLIEITHILHGSRDYEVLLFDE